VIPKGARRKSIKGINTDQSDTNSAGNNNSFDADIFELLQENAQVNDTIQYDKPAAVKEHQWKQKKETGGKFLPVNQLEKNEEVQYDF
jgi:hypothetical protein